MPTLASWPVFFCYSDTSAKAVPDARAAASAALVECGTRLQQRQTMLQTRTICNKRCRIAEAKAASMSLEGL